MGIAPTQVRRGMALLKGQRTESQSQHSPWSLAEDWQLGVEWTGVIKGEIDGMAVGRRLESQQQMPLCWVPLPHPNRCHLSCMEHPPPYNISLESGNSASLLTPRGPTLQGKLPVRRFLMDTPY